MQTGFDMNAAFSALASELMLEIGFEMPNMGVGARRRLAISLAKAVMSRTMVLALQNDASDLEDANEQWASANLTHMGASIGASMVQRDLCFVERRPHPTKDGRVIHGLTALVLHPSMKGGHNMQKDAG